MCCVLRGTVRLPCRMLVSVSARGIRDLVIVVLDVVISFNDDGFFIHRSFAHHLTSLNNFASSCALFTLFSFCSC